MVSPERKMQIPQIHTSEQASVFFSRPTRLAFVSFEPISNGDGSTRKGWNLIFYCSERDQVFIVLDYQNCPFRVPSYRLPERLGAIQVERLPFELDVTMERLLPGMWLYEAIVYHLKRYAFARDCLKSGSVLDCACGVGYGLNMILHRSDIPKGVGVDINEFAVSFSKRLVKDPRAQFSTALPDGTFENIVCLETLEHVSDPYQFMTELVKRLNPEGQLILSVPEERYDGSNINTFHISNWNRKRFVRFLSFYFAEATVYCQHPPTPGAHTFFNGEVQSESRGHGEDAILLAKVRMPRNCLRKRLVCRRTGSLDEVRMAVPVIEKLKADNPDKDVLVVTNQCDPFIGDPNADLVLTPAWSGEVNMDLNGLGN